MVHLQLHHDLVGQVSEAEALYREALQGRRKVLGNLDATKIHGGEANVGDVAFFLVRVGEERFSCAFWDSKGHTPPEI